jgi:hypothetical protein
MDDVPKKSSDAATANEQQWTAEELADEFDLLGLFVSPTIVRRKADGMRGTIRFKGNPRLFFDFRSFEPS